MHRVRCVCTPRWVDMQTHSVRAVAGICGASHPFPPSFFLHCEHLWGFPPLSPVLLHCEQSGTGDTKENEADRAGGQQT